MTKAMYGVWPSQADYTNGDAPSMAGEATWDEVLDSVCGEESRLNDRENTFIATRVGEDWIPVTFLNATNRKANGISEGQTRKYLNKRNRNNPTNNFVTEQQQTQQQEDVDGSIVLQVSPKVAELFRDAFTLIASGRQVTIQTAPQDQQ